MGETELKPVVYIIGPTASGKTGLSVFLAKHFGGEIICADSMQIYENMPIASAAPTKQEMRDVPHHMFEFLPPDQPFSVSDYVDIARAGISALHSKGVLPFVVGGTGLYINSLAENICFSAEKGNKDQRESLEKTLSLNGAEYMHNYLKKIDPESAKKISVNDHKRILRAIEVYKLTGLTKTKHNEISKKGGPIYNNIFIGLRYSDRALLYDRINRRVDSMLENGLIEEAEKAFESKNTTTASQAIGHKEFFPAFSGEKSFEDCAEHLKMQTRRYAKRQMTWFLKIPDVFWIDMDLSTSPAEEASEYIKSRLI